MANLNGWNRQLSPEISAEYLFVQKLMSWSYEVMTNETKMNDTFYFLDGGDVHHALKLSVDHGLLPQEFFKPRIPFANWDVAKLYSDVKEIAKEGRSVLSRVTDDSIRKQVLRIFIRKIQDRIVVESGTMPARFLWNGRQWSTRTFENAFGVKRDSHVFLMYPKGLWDMGDPWDLRRVVVSLVQTFRGAFNYRQSSWSQIWSYIIQSVDNRLPVLVSMKWAGSYHVLNIVGYEYNAQSEIVSFKLKNSWDEGYGDNGYAYFFPPDLQKNVTAVWGFQAPLRY